MISGKSILGGFNADLMIGRHCFHGCCGSNDYHVLRWADFALLADQGVEAV